MQEAAKWYRTKGPDVIERYSPPRIVREAGLRACAGKRLKPGWSLGPTTDDPETGNPWNLADGKVRTKATKSITEGKPLCVIQSPVCTALCQMQNINTDRRDAQVYKRELEEATDHFRWTMRVCSLQQRHNRYFVFSIRVGHCHGTCPRCRRLLNSKGLTS